MTILSEYEQQAARLLKMVMIALEFPQQPDKSDLTACAMTLKKMPNQNEVAAPLATALADRALLFGFYNQPGDCQQLMGAAHALLQVLETKGLSG